MAFKAERCRKQISTAGSASPRRFDAGAVGRLPEAIRSARTRVCSKAVWLFGAKISRAVKPSRLMGIARRRTVASDANFKAQQFPVPWGCSNVDCSCA